MFSSVFVILAFLVSLGFSGIIAVALFTYIRRTWQVMRSEREGSIHHRILDGLDQIHIRMDFLQERMESLEKSLREAAPPPELPGGNSQDQGEE